MQRAFNRWRYSLSSSKRQSKPQNQIFSFLGGKQWCFGCHVNKIAELSGYSVIEAEKTIDNSRIDIYLANEENGILVDETYVEVKSVTLIKDGKAQFPDAPTERGRKHLRELIGLKKRGIRAVVFFLIEHPNGNSFRPNWENDPEFSKTLNEAYDAGVEIIVYKTENTL